MAFLLTLLFHVPPVLMYHRIDVWSPPDPISRSLTITPARLAAQLAELRRHGYRGIGINDLYRCLSHRCKTSRLVLLTFDDAYGDQYLYAFPILRRFGMTATFFITTSSVGKPNHLTWSEIRAMARAGMTIGGHNVEHVSLARLSDVAQAYQITHCIAMIYAHAHVPITAYAYPSGALDSYAVALLRREGIVLAFTTDRLHTERGISPRYQLTRIRVESPTDVARASAAIFPLQPWIRL
jgi:peptidoglycan/xylan/chitin deacetylase (PgdA/CDA1 family)